MLRDGVLILGKDGKEYSIREMLIGFKGIFIIPGFIKEAEKLLLYLCKFFKRGMLPTTLTE